MARSRVGLGHAQAGHRSPAEHADRVDRLAGGDAGEPPARPGAEVARTLRDDGHLGAQHEARGEQPRVQRDRLEVAAVRLTDGHRADQPPGAAQLGDRPGERERQRTAVGHDVRDPRRRADRRGSRPAPLAARSGGRPPRPACRPGRRRRGARRGRGSPARRRRARSPAAACSAPSRGDPARPDPAAAGRAPPRPWRTRRCRGRGRARRCSRGRRRPPRARRPGRRRPAP